MAGALAAAAGCGWLMPSLAEDVHLGEPGYGEQLIMGVLATGSP
jgi:hypothetical protein